MGHSTCKGSLDLLQSQTKFQVKKSVQECGFDQKMIEEHIYEVWVASYFLMRKEFPLDGHLRPQAREPKSAKNVLTEENFQKQSM